MEKHNDAGTSDFLTGLMEKHEKMAWMLRSYNEK
jgi:starvation-inducible DNA-binding protein